MSKCTIHPRLRTWGFRFFATDAIVLTVLAVGTATLWWMKNPAWWLLPTVGGHFFLFCNIVRMRRAYELIWSALFLVNAVGWMAMGRFSSAMVLGCQWPITAVLVIAEMRSKWYHGIFARRVNPRLEEYLRGEWG